MEWKFIPGDQERIKDLSRSLNLPFSVCRLLLNRGLHEADIVRDFFSPSLNRLPSPTLMKDMDKAVNRILKACQQKERIAVFGDYDADGVTATALLVHFLKPLFPELLYYIPHRLREGYGLSLPGITTLKERGISLIITVDCGISNHQEIEFAQGLGIEVIVTDHHQISKKGVPSAVAVLNPKQPGCGFPFKELAGVGVAFYLLIALRQTLDGQGFFSKGKPNLKVYLDRVALGTVADVVPLLGVNRIFVREGLEVLSRSPHTGLAALKEVCGLPADRALSAYDIGFRLAPRINALGRIEEAGGGVQLLTTDDLLQAKDMAQHMHQENTRRQALEQKMLLEIDQLLMSKTDWEKRRTLVLGSETWHRGILGLAASRLTERYSKPVFLFSIEGEMAHGSGRSVEGFHLFNGLEALEGFLTRFGGHEAAAGATLPSLDLLAFEEALENLVQDTVPESTLGPSLSLEGECDFVTLVKEIASVLPWMAPFGEKNPEPLLASRQVKVKSLRKVGNGHLKLKLEQQGMVVDGIGFGMGHMNLQAGEQIDLAYHPFISEYNGASRLELRIRDIQRA
ncbi:MAG: single-stranded-DNA-specific exonuclease RecJ [Thermodesulfobacteriota bacterium]